MNGITILIWITIALIAIISIIGVKLHYRGDQLEHEEGSILPSGESINKAISIGKNTLGSSSNSSKNNTRSLSPNRPQQDGSSHLFRKGLTSAPKDDAYIVPEVEQSNITNYEYESQNQVLINYDNTVEKFQEPIKQSQMDIMTQNNNKDEETTELKDLFTIDELIKESKRKDSEREKESQKIKRDAEEDKELSDIKKSIKDKKENKAEEPLIEEIIEEDEKEETIGDLIKDVSSDEKEEKPAETAEDIPLPTSQKEIDEVINTASQEKQDEIESIAEEETITDAVMKPDDEQKTLDEISEPTLKTPHKVEKPQDYKMGASIDDANLFGDDEEDGMDLDYRKDLNRFTNKIKGSRIFQDVREKLVPEKEEADDAIQEDSETYIRNVNEYEDEYTPIINETHIDYEEEFEKDFDQRLREENTRRMFKSTRRAPEPEVARPVGAIKSKPARDNIKIQINNNEFVLKKGDEIIFNHQGETYSSQVYAIKGDDISVKYRRKHITIKPSDVKKIY